MDNARDEIPENSGGGKLVGFSRAATLPTWTITHKESTVADVTSRSTSSRHTVAWNGVESASKARKFQGSKRVAGVLAQANLILDSTAPETKRVQPAASGTRHIVKEAVDEMKTRCLCKDRAVGGALADFIGRMSPGGSKHKNVFGRRRSSALRHLGQACGSSKSRRDNKESEFGRDNQGVTGGAREVGFIQALSAVQRERLFGEFMEEITSFKKSSDDPEWRSCKQAFKKQALKLVRDKHEHACLRTEVEALRLRHQLLNKRPPDRAEIFEERRERLRGFWSEFHASSKKLELANDSTIKLPKLDRRSWESGSPSQTQIWPRDGKGRTNTFKQIQQKTLARNGISLPSLSRTSEDFLTRSRPGSKQIQKKNLARSTNSNSLPSLSNTQRTGSHSCLSRGDRRADQLPPLAVGDTPTKTYMRVCHENKIVPTLLPFVTGHSLKFNARQKALVDQDLMAVVVMIPSFEKIEEVDLGGNGLLTEKALVPFMQSLIANPAVSSLLRLELSQCRQIARASLELLVHLLSSSDGARSLRHLDLSGVSVTTRMMYPVCKAIRKHPCLKCVNLVDISLGKNGGAQKCIDELVGSSTVQELDVGWNSFGYEDFAHLGSKLVEMQKLQILRLSNCSVASNIAGDVIVACPIIFFLEQLALNTTLVQLDVSLNRIDFRGALVLEDALGQHKRLRDLNVSHNPLGVIGMRSVLRLLSRSGSALTHFLCERCFSGSIADSQVDNKQVFSQSHPAGRYILNLGRPYHRTLLRMLYKTSERYGLSPADAFTDLVFSSPPYNHPTKAGNGIWPVREDGQLMVTFSIEKGLETALSGIPNGAFQLFLDKHKDLMRMKPDFHKIVPLFAQWSSISGNDLEQRVFLDALSKDFLITYPQLEHLVRTSRGMTSEVMTSILPCVVGGAGVRYLSLLLTPSLGEYISNHYKLWNLIGFTPENPTGHYKLNLAMSADHSVAESLLLLDRWEVSIGRRLQRRDVSQRANRSQVRNPRYQDRPLDLHDVQSVAEWHMPEADILDLDYVSGKRPPSNAQVLDDATFNRILAVLQGNECHPASVVEVLRQVSGHVFISSLQLRGMLGSFHSDVHRADVFVIYFMRVVDMHNEKVFRVRFENLNDLARLRERLGYVTCFPFIQPEQGQFKLNFRNYDERVAITVLLSLRGKESLGNIRSPAYVREDGSVDPLPLGVPRSWETLEKQPTAGIFTCSYSCAPEDRCFAERRRMMQDYGFWQVNVPEEQVMWWSALTEAPTDVLEFLEFILTRFGDVYAAFRAIDGGEDGNGVLTLREFEEGFAAMGCKKFSGPDERNRIAGIFRYLDPSGEGEVSIGEWGVMEQLWKEMQLCFHEFVNFLKNQFDDAGEDSDVDDVSAEENSPRPKSFIDRAYEFMDEDGSGEIDEQEWADVVRERLNFFGPCDCIFGFLDKDDEGTISLEEFRALEAFLPDSAIGHGA